MRSTVSSLAALAAVVAASCPSLAAGYMYNRTVETEYGPVQGFKYFNTTTTKKYFNQSDSHVAAFLGIPYAADTGYQNRWKPAQPREKWNETYYADDFGPACPIASKAQQGYTLSEDCLSVNVWTPARSPDEKLPVFVWNYGSGETSGEATYDAGGLATKDIVTVTYNYRDAAFGFQALPELLEESSHNSTGNYGILDFITVLKWVQKNIDKFGGDPDRVVIAGQSFGSAQVFHAVNSPLAKGLFHGMISESGIRYPHDPLLAGIAASYRNMSHALALGKEYLSSHNCTNVACLREQTMEQILEGSDDRDASIPLATQNWTATPPLYKTTLDDYVVPNKYIKSLLDGPANDVPMITGNNKDESGAEYNINLTVADYEKTTKAFYGEDFISEYRKLWPSSNDTEASKNWNDAADWLSITSVYLFANQWIKSPAKSPFWTYFWDHAQPGTTSGAKHMAEINYVLRNLYKTDLPWTEYDIYLSDVMSSYWANFVKTLNPNQGGSWDNSNGTLPTWTQNKENKKQVMRLGNGFGNFDFADTKVSFFAKFFAKQEAY